MAIILTEPKDIKRYNQLREIITKYKMDEDNAFVGYVSSNDLKIFVPRAGGYHMVNLYGNYPRLGAYTWDDAFLVHPNYDVMDSDCTKYLSQVKTTSKKPFKETYYTNDDIKNLCDIYSDLKAGDLVLYQLEDNTNNTISEPRMAIIVGVDVWDMALAVYYSDYKRFECKNKGKWPEVQGFGEWMDFWRILGHWKSMPALSELKIAYRKANNV